MITHLPTTMNFPLGTILPYPYVDATTHEDAAAGRMVGVIGWLDERDTIHIVDKDGKCQEGCEGIHQIMVSGVIKARGRGIE